MALLLRRRSSCRYFSVGIGTTGASVGTISTITVLNGGSGYTGIVTISISNPPDNPQLVGTTALATAIILTVQLLVQISPMLVVDMERVHTR